jgi:hypothetical protein
MAENRKRFLIELIKPSHYDDDGYVIQWWRGFIPSNSLSALYGIALDARERRAVGDEIIVVSWLHLASPTHSRFTRGATSATRLLASSRQDLLTGQIRWASIASPYAVSTRTDY